MAKLTIKQELPKPPPKTYVLELTEREALALCVLTGRTAGDAEEVYDIFTLLDEDDKAYRKGLEFFTVTNTGSSFRLDRKESSNGEGKPRAR